MARCLALLGMVATHMLEERTPTGELALGQAVAGGRASALFAVLAGVTLAMSSGRETPLRGRERTARSAGLAVRALLIGVAGLLLGEVQSGLAIILTYYAALFLLGLPFLGLRARMLVPLCVAWLVVTPVLSHLLRPHLPERGFASPSLRSLAEPGQLLTELLFTGYYPVLPWLAYLLAGMALGRLRLGARPVQAALAAAGAGLAALAHLLSDRLTSRADVQAALVEDPPTSATADQLLDRASEGLFGTTPTGGAWQWLLLDAPHTATPFDLAATIGSSVLVVGVALVVVGLLPAVGERFVAVLFGAGTMTLTLYSLHVLMRSPDVWPPERPEEFSTHVLVIGAIGAVYVAIGQRGPLERVVGAAADGTTRLLSGRAGATRSPGRCP